MKQIALAGDPVPDEEADDDPYPKEMLPENPIGNLSRPERIFMLEDQPKGYKSMAGWTSFCFLIPQKELMAFVSSIDGSPASFVASLLYKVITQLYPENRLPIVCGMQHQLRKALGRSFSHLCHVNVVPYLDMTLSGGISVEIFSVGEVFSVNIMQRNDDSRYADAFSKLLRENGIQYTAEKPERFCLCGFQLPDS